MVCKKRDDLKILLNLYSTRYLDLRLLMLQQSSGMVGALSPDEFPSEAVSTLYNTGRPQQYTPGERTSTSSSNKKKEERRIGSLISLLDPPPGFVMPELNDQQKQNYERLKELRQGVGTVVYMRATGNLDGLGMNCGLGTFLLLNEEIMYSSKSVNLIEPIIKILLFFLF